MPKATPKPEIGIGTVLWRYQDFWRKTFAEKFSSKVVVEETAKELIVDDPNYPGQYRETINKRSMMSGTARTGKTLWFLEKERDDRIWMMTHRHRVRDKLDRCEDADILRQVAALVGYKEETE